MSLKGLGEFLQHGRDFLFPPCCAACDATGLDDPAEFLCEECQSELRVLIPSGCPCELSPSPPDSLRVLCNLCRHLPFHFDSARSAFPYEGIAGELIRRLKYRRGPWAGRILARMAIAALADWAHQVRTNGTIDLIAPVPMHATRELWRGYNHSEILAAEVALLLGIKMNPLVARRCRRTPQQSRRHGVEKRLRNMEGAFDVPEPEEIAGRSILLVDDVMTTGATVATCAAALKEAGARAVHVLTIARAGGLPSEALIVEEKM